jgi:hypothetical protein
MDAERKQRREERFREKLRRFDDLSDNAVVSPKYAAALLDMSERTIRYHEQLKRVYLSKARYGFSCGNVRQLLRGEVPSC